MRNYQPRDYQFGNVSIRFDAGNAAQGTGMRHIMARHVPETWNGVTSNVQTFFARGTTPADIQRMVGEVLQQHRSTIIANATSTDLSLVGRTPEGANIAVRISQGRVVTAFPTGLRAGAATLVP